MPPTRRRLRAPAAPARQRPRGDAAATPAHPVTAPIPVIGAQPVARTTARPASPQPIPAQAPAVAPVARADEAAEDDKVTVLRGHAEDPRGEHGRVAHGPDRDERAHRSRRSS